MELHHRRLRVLLTLRLSFHCQLRHSAVASCPLRLQLSGQSRGAVLRMTAKTVLGFYASPHAYSVRVTGVCVFSLTSHLSCTCQFSDLGLSERGECGIEPHGRKPSEPFSPCVPLTVTAGGVLNVILLFLPRLALMKKENHYQCGAETRTPVLPTHRWGLPRGGN